MRDRKKYLQSKSGIWFTLDFNKKKQECRIICLNESSEDFSRLKADINDAILELALKVSREEFNNIIYKCPWDRRQTVIDKIKDC